MAAFAVSPEAQLRQTHFRQRLVEVWGIPAGSRILEIGCGQGDTTAVLAHAVGPGGSVLATDVADPEYGAPISLGDSAAFLKVTPLGKRVEFRFRCDLLDPTVRFPDDSFDAVVLAHCSWYFPSVQTLSHLLKRIRLWTPRLLLSEWDLEPRSASQTAHMLAVLLQGQAAAFDADTLANVRTPLSKARLKQILEQTGWRIGAESTVDSTGLDDGAWEIATALDTDLDIFPAVLREIAENQREVLRGLSSEPTLSLSSYALDAHRLPALHDEGDILREV
ncbi:methyltransferase domain-containing protein [bacterium]|nr:MAG: methyltransferase domain-containing protein [bacterium]